MRDVLSPGTLLEGKYRIDYALGRGGFGITYRAMHVKLEQLVAVKEFYPQEYAHREGTTGRLTVAKTQQDPYQRGLNHRRSAPIACGIGGEASQGKRKSNPGVSKSHLSLLLKNVPFLLQ
jgi:serine/threonine protein kinase